MSFFRKALDTATTIKRIAVDTYVLKPLSGVCPKCNNLSPIGHHDSSNNSHGFMDTSTLKERQTVTSGAIWLTLEITIEDLLKTAKGEYAKALKPCFYCAFILEVIQHHLPHWWVTWFSTDPTFSLTPVRFPRKAENNDELDDGNDTVEDEDEHPSSDENSDDDSASDDTDTGPEDDHEPLTLVLVEGQPIVVKTHTRNSEGRWSTIALEIGREAGILNFFSFSPSSNTDPMTASHNVLSSLIPHCGTLIERSMRSDDQISWDFVHKCIDECNNQHGQCLDAKSPAKLPKRVLDLESKNDSLRLYETQPGEKAAYAALSHCWGSGGHPLRTLTGNLDRMKIEIDIQDLNETFRNAIKICRELNLRYIWIDSLCIIQDSTEDWEEQAALMADIYKNAYATIATGSSPGPTTSIFCERDAIWKSWKTQLGAGDVTEQVRVRRKVLPALEVADRNSPNLADMASYNARHSAHSAWDYQWDGPLYTRAWCFQEHLLSKRMIHFTPGAIIWGCMSNRHVEGETPIAISAKKPTSAKPTAQERDIQWRTSVSNYFKRNITYTSDRLVALSGVASDMAGKMNDEYLAGLWKSSLFWDLLWYPDPWVEMPVPKEYLAPSWSWASLGGPVTWSSYNASSSLKTYVEVKGAETIVKTTLNPYGNVISGSITLRGPAFRGFIVSDKALIDSDEGMVRIMGSWEKKGGGHYILPDVRLYEADGLLKDGMTEKTCRRAEPDEAYRRCIGEDGDLVPYFMPVTVLCLYTVRALALSDLFLEDPPPFQVHIHDWRQSGSCR